MLGAENEIIIKEEQRRRYFWESMILIRREVRGLGVVDAVYGHVDGRHWMHE